MKRPRRREIQIISILLFAVVSVVGASSRAADPFAPSTTSSTRYSDDDFYFEDVEDDDDNEQVEPLVDNDSNDNEQGEWWMDPLAAFEDEEEDTTVFDPLMDNGADFLDDVSDTKDPTQEVKPDTILDDYVYESDDNNNDNNSKFENDNYDNFDDDDDDFLDDFYSPLDEPKGDAYDSPRKPSSPSLDTPSPETSSPSVTTTTTQQDDYENLDDDWTDVNEDDFQDNRVPSTPSSDSYAPKDEVDPTTVLEPSKTILAPRNGNRQKDDTVYDPVTPLPAPIEAKKPPKASSFGFGSKKSNHIKKKPPRQRVTGSFGGNNDNNDLTSPISSPSSSSIFLPTAAIASSIAALLPRITHLVSGNAAAVTLVAITVGKFVAYFVDKSEDDKMRASVTTKPQPTRKKKKKKTKRRDVSRNKGEYPEEEDEEEEEEDFEEDNKEYDAAGQVVRRVKKPVETPKLQNLVRPTPNPSKQGRGWLGSLVQNSSQSISQSLPQPNKRNQVEELRKRAEQAEIDKANMEREYEKTSWELQETQSELNSLKASTRHLQAQITDNEEMLDRVVQAERRRAKEELQRMKEAMVKVVEEEREAMRSEFLKQAGELQMLWRKGRQEKYQPDQPTSSGRRPVPKRHYS